MLLNFITYIEEAVMCKEKLYRDQIKLYFPLLSIRFAYDSGEVLIYCFLVLSGQNPYS